jgi:hypothetical protein
VLTAATPIATTDNSTRYILPGLLLSPRVKMVMCVNKRASLHRTVVYLLCRSTDSHRIVKELSKAHYLLAAYLEETRILHNTASGSITWEDRWYGLSLGVCFNEYLM